MRNSEAKAYIKKKKKLRSKSFSTVLSESWFTGDNYNRSFIKFSHFILSLRRSKKKCMAIPSPFVISYSLYDITNIKVISFKPQKSLLETIIETIATPLKED